MKHTSTTRSLYLCLLLAPVFAVEAKPSLHRVDTETSVTFKSSDPELQKLYNVGMAELQKNIKQFTPKMKVLVEGGGYNNAWLETQPMGGEMFAKHNLQIAMNNQVIFMLGQRADGRLPGMVVQGAMVKTNAWEQKGFPKGYQWRPEYGLVADYEMFQGYCFPEPAWRVYFWAGKDKDYLKDLDAALKGHDAYLWRTRDSNGDGILETWCVWDTGEDGSTRLGKRGAHHNWPYEIAPGTDDPQLPKAPEGSRMPFQSMDIMAYSYSGRAVLAKIAQELGTGESSKWQAAAEEVRQRVIQKLWDPKRHACFDRDRDGRTLDELIHNNLRCMWFGMFKQDMADAFIKYHLLNPDEFWTPVPLVSIAVNDPLFFNGRKNNWSGQPQGLTYQRAIGALENYGHYAEVSLLGQKLLPVLIRNGYQFSQQLDPYSGEPSLSNSDGYGPIILAAHEYISRMHGIHIDVEKGQVWWSALADNEHDFSYTQRWGKHHFSLTTKDGKLRAMVNGALSFESTTGSRVVTDLAGNLISVVGISPKPQAVEVQRGASSWSGKIQPNQVMQFDGDQLILTAKVPFDYPYQSPEKPGRP